MKTGKSLVELAQEIQRQATAKADFVAPVHALSISTNDRTTLSIEDHGAYAVTPTTHRQLSSHLGIPADFYDRLHASSTDLRDPYDPDRSLFEATLNALLRARPADERRLVRTLDGNARAFLRNAVTSLAADAPMYDRSTELESIGGQVLALPPATAREPAAAA